MGFYIRAYYKDHVQYDELSIVELEPWIFARFEVIHRFHHHVFQRRRRCQPKELLRFLRLDIEDKRDPLRRSWLSSRHIRDPELRCQINLFWASYTSAFHMKDEQNIQLTEILIKEGT